MKKTLLMILLLAITGRTIAQNVARTGNNIPDANKMSAASKSGNVNDALTNFYQVSLRNIFGKDGEISFSTTVFGLLDSLNNKIEDDSQYGKYRWARNIQLNANGKIDSANNISSFGGGITISVINRRDVTKKTEAFKVLEPIELEIAELKNNARKSITGDSIFCASFAKKLNIDTSIVVSAINALITKSVSQFHSSHDVRDLDTNFVNELKRTGELDRYVALIKEDDSMFAAIEKNIERRGLWTAGATYRHYLKVANDTLGFQTDYIVGLGRNTQRKLWEFAANASVKSFTDLALKQATTAHAEMGINKVLLEGKDKNSKMELKFFASYDHNLTDNSDPVFAGNLTWRVNVFKDLWLPVTIKYDDNGKLWGFLSITYNLDKYKTNN